MPEPRFKPQQITIDGKTVNVRPERYEIVHEGWNEYRTESGFRVRVKLTVSRIAHALDDKGRILRMKGGDPHMVLGHSVEIVVDEEDGS